VIGIFRQMKQGAYDREQLEQRLLDRGFANRFFLRSLFRLIDKSWHMFPLGFVFGLGFGTATETGLLAVAAGAAGEVPVIAVLSLPIIFAAGMTALDTLDGVFMTRAYGWAFSNPVRKIYYNITITALTVAVALAVGSVELLHVLATRLQLTSGVWGWLDAIDFQVAGYAIVGIFVLTWGASVLVWKTSRIEERFGAFLERTS
jgi:high-affinity nickel-transport protein